MPVGVILRQPTEYLKKNIEPSTKIKKEGVRYADAKIKLIQKEITFQLITGTLQSKIKEEGQIESLM